MTDSQPVPQQRSRNAKLVNFANFTELPKKIELLEKFKLSYKRRFKPMEMRKAESFFPPSPKINVTSTVWNISTGQPGCLSGHAPSQVPHTFSLAECEKLVKSPWFHSNSWKHQCYQPSTGTKSQTQHLLRRKLTLSQLKPGHQPTPTWMCLLNFLAGDQLSKNCNYPMHLFTGQHCDVTRNLTWRA